MAKWEVVKEGKEPGLITRSAFALGRGFESPGQIASALSNALFGAPLVAQGHRPVTTKVQEALGYTPEQLSAQSVPERYLHRVAEQAPGTILASLIPGLGGAANIAPAITRSAISNVPATLVEQSGLPYADELAALSQIGSEYGLGKVGRTLSEAGKHPQLAKYLGYSPPTIGQQQQRAYTAAKQAVPEGAGVASPILEKSISDVQNALKTQYRDIAPKVEEVLEKVKGLITPSLTSEEEATIAHLEGLLENASSREKPKIVAKINDIYNHASKTLNPKDIIDSKRGLNELGPAMMKQDFERYIVPIKEGLNKTAADYGLINPSFFNHLNEAEKLTAVKNMASPIGTYGSELATKVAPPKYRQLAKLLPDVIDSTLGRILRAPYAFMANPTARNHYIALNKAAVKQNPGQFFKHLEKLSEFLQDISPMSRSEESASDGWEEVR